MSAVKGPIGSSAAAAAAAAEAARIAAAQEAARRAAQEAARIAAQAEARKAAEEAARAATQQAAQTKTEDLVAKHSGPRQLVDLNGGAPLARPSGLGATGAPGLNVRDLQATLKRGGASTLLTGVSTGGNLGIASGLGGGAPSGGSTGTTLGQTVNVRTLLASLGTNGSGIQAFAGESNLDAASGSGAVEATDATGGTPLTPEEQAKEDAKKVDTAIREGGAEAGAQVMADLVQQHPNDPAYADALIAECSKAPEGEWSSMQKITNLLASRADNGTDDGDGRWALTENTVNDLSIVYGAASDTGKKQIVDQLVEKLPNGDLNQFDDRLAELSMTGQDNGLFGAVQSALVASGKTEAATAMATEQTNQAREEYDTLAQQKAEADAQLNTELAAVGSTMSPEEIEKYKQDFYASHDVYAKYDAAADKLSTTLATNRAALETAAANGDEDAAKALVDGYTALASTPTHADEAIQWMSDVSQAPVDQNPLFQSLDKATKGDLAKDIFGEKILAAAVPNAQAEILAKHVGSDPDAAQKAFDEFNDLMDGLTTAQSLGTIGAEVGEFLRATAEGVKGNYEALAESQFGDWDQKNGLGKALAVAAFTQSVVATGGSLADGNYPEALQNALEATEGGLEIAAGTIDTLGRAGKIAPDAARFAAKAVPYVGLVVDLVQGSEDLKNLLNDPRNAGYYVAAIGTAISLVGDVAGMVPVLGWVPDAFLGLLGEGVHMVGGAIADAINGNKDEKEHNQEMAGRLSRATGVSEETALEMVEAGPNDLARMRELGLTSEQIQELAADPNVDLSSMETAVLLKAAALFGLNPADTMALLKAGQDNQDLVDMMVGFIGDDVTGDPQAVAQARDGMLLMMDRSGEGEVANILRNGAGEFNETAYGTNPYEVLEGDGVQIDP